MGGHPSASGSCAKWSGKRKAEQRKSMQKCKNCDYAVTGLAPDYCCWKCKETPGQHGPKCAKRNASSEDLISESISAPRKKCALTESQLGGGKRQTAPDNNAETCKNCEYPVTGIVPGYCCWMCKSKPGKHGPTCGGSSGKKKSASTASELDDQLE